MQELLLMRIVHVSNEDKPPDVADQHVLLCRVVLDRLRART
eukprot:CAMPEP_0119086496 /NCGR_PEP_ID=MMETSP1178-20130426/138161_1 /TAXON_ID=33656 /ORGANISM="unid sp, Strain CCMP2000" /LENGTH=40 /DNA_ID= /DNA_START= /DNA_END= /DNA_ORIENTATION=